MEVERRSYAEEIRRHRELAAESGINLARLGVDINPDVGAGWTGARSYSRRVQELFVRPMARSSQEGSLTRVMSRSGSVTT